MKGSWFSFASSDVFFSMIGLYDRIIQCQVKHYCCHLGFKTPLGLKVISYQRNWVNQQNTSIVDTLGLISCLNHWDSTYIIYRCSSPESGERDVDLPHEFYGVYTVSPGMSCLKFHIPVKPCLSRIVSPQKIAVDAQQKLDRG